MNMKTLSRSDSIERIKEQLRFQSQKLRHRESVREKSDQKIRYIIEASQQKIQDLKSELESKSASWQTRVTQGLKNNSSSPHSDQRNTTTHNPLSPNQEVEIKFIQTPPIKEVYVVDPKLVKALKFLKEKHDAFKVRIHTEKKEREKFQRQKHLLLKEVKRLRKNPSKVSEVKENLQEIESHSQAFQDRYQELLMENQRLALSYEQALAQHSESGQIQNKKDETLKLFQLELEALKNAKSALERDLEEEKQLFEQNLATEIEKVEKELKNKIKGIRKNKSNLEQFAEGVMDDTQAPLWMITYSDMVTLLLTFFILYYSIAAVNISKFKNAILGQENASIGLLELLDSVEIKKSIQSLTGLKSDDILSDVRKIAEKVTSMDVAIRQAKVAVQVPGGTLFEPNSADLQKEGLPVLNEVIRVIGKYPEYKINIRGHTDDTPIFTERFPTNWELASSRATAVLRHFIDKGIDPERITATGFADTFPLVSNVTKAGRAKNRRVEIVLEKQ
jgi:chemotaxis protein MotB